MEKNHENITLDINSEMVVINRYNTLTIFHKQSISLVSFIIFTTNIVIFCKNIKRLIKF
jgi:hypothetical protein